MNRWLAAIMSIAVFAQAAARAAGADGKTDPASLVGVWTLNKDLSDATPERPQGTDERGRGLFGGRRGGGGLGRGGSSGGFPGRSAGGSPEEQRRRTEAMRAIMEAPERLTITRTESLVIITDGDGRTIRLSPDGKKIKDESTGIERKTKCDGNKLVTEITGSAAGKITETYAVDEEHSRLTVTLQMDNSRGPASRVMHRAYDRDHK